MTGRTWQILIPTRLTSLISAGGYNGVYLDQILEFDPRSGEWSLLDEGMLEPRFGHAVTSIPWERVQHYCS